MVERDLAKVEVAGSIPVIRLKIALAWFHAGAFFNKIIFSNDMRLEGKTVVVTGASSGMGHAGDGSSYVNGAILPVDGGWTAG